MSAAVASALRFRSGESVKAFLLGRWSLAKKLDYRIGGGKGIMSGTATFSEIPQKTEALMYEERGTVQLEGMSSPFEAYRRYIFNTGVWPVEVYFVDDPSKKHLDSLIPELEYHTSFFIPLPFTDGPDSGGSSASAEHLCIKDLYAGSLMVTSQSTFEWRWSIKGPQKDADIEGRYTRNE